MLNSNDPFYKVFLVSYVYQHEDDFMVTVGKNLSKFGSNLTTAYVERLDRLHTSEKIPIEGEVQEPLVSSAQTIEPDLKGMHLLASASRLFFEVPLNQISTSVITIHNRGTVSLYFEWVREHKPNPLHVKMCKDGAQRFFFNYTQGVIVPGTAFDFPIVFKSARNGIFTETWKLLTFPPLLEDKAISITLQVSLP